LTTTLWRLLFPDLYTEIEKLKRRVNDLSTDVQALDAALDTLGADVGELRDAVTNLINSLPPEVDLTAEVQRVNDAFASIESTTAAAKEATPPAPPPTT
jgi:uncharacterized protein YoxC